MATFKVNDLVVGCNGSDFDGELFRVAGFETNRLGRELVAVTRYLEPEGRTLAFYPGELRAVRERDERTACLAGVKEVLGLDRYEVDRAITRLATNGDCVKADAISVLIGKLNMALNPDSCDVCHSMFCSGAYGGIHNSDSGVE